MDVNQAIVSAIERCGADHVFGGSGQVNASMLLALRDSKRVRTVIVRNEQAASFMACGYATFSDKLGVCFATGGPGAFNLFSGMAVAYSDSLPVLAITGYTSAPMRGKGALNEATGRSRTPDSMAMFASTTKKSFIIEDAKDVWDVMEEAVNTAWDGRPGPVHVHVPKNVTVADVPVRRDIEVRRRPVAPRARTVETFADRLERALSRSEPLLLLIGYGAVRSHAEPELLAFVERYQVPFVTTMDAKGILPEDHPLSLGVYGTSGDPGAVEAFDAAEVVLAVGNSFAQNATFGFKPDLYANKVLLHINIDAREIGKVYEPDCGMVSDAKAGMAAIVAALAGRVGPVARRRVEKKKFHDDVVEYSGERVHPAALVQALSELLPPGCIVMGDAGSHMLWANCYLSLARNQIYQNPGSFGPMASHVNGAMGAKCANPDRPVVCACGDGGYLMGGFELLTAVQYDIPVVWVIFNNGEFNIIKKFLLNTYGEHAFMTFRNPDYVGYARACGAVGHRVNRLDEFAPAFQEALRANRPALIDVAVEGDVYPPFALSNV